MPSSNPEEYQVVRLIPGALRAKMASLKQMSAALLAGCLGTTEQAVADLAEGRVNPTLAQARRVATQLNMPVEALVDPASRTPAPQPPFGAPATTPPAAIPAPASRAVPFPYPPDPPAVEAPAIAPQAPPRRPLNSRLFDPDLDATARERSLSLAQSIVLAELASLVVDRVGGVQFDVAVAGQLYEALVPLACLVAANASGQGVPLDQVFSG